MGLLDSGVKTVDGIVRATVWRDEECANGMYGVTFGLNVRLNSSRRATTKSLCSLQTKLLFKVLCKSTQTVTIRVIRGDEGVGDIPGILGGSGEPVGSAQYSSIDTRTQT